jgi:hypothetical protein
MKSVMYADDAERRPDQKKPWKRTSTSGST